MHLPDDRPPDPSGRPARKPATSRGLMAGFLGPNHARSLRAMGQGIELLIIIAGLTIVGYYADRFWGTTPWLTLSGALLGTVGGCYNAAKEAFRLQGRNARPSIHPPASRAASDQRRRPPQP